MKFSAALQKTDLKPETINVYEDELKKIKDGQERMSAEMDDMDRILDSTN